MDPRRRITVGLGRSVRSGVAFFLVGKRAPAVVLATMVAIGLGAGVGCRGPGSDRAGAARESASSGSNFSPARESGQPTTPAQFGLGRIAREDEIAAWDLDVGPNGRGLPPGSGNARAGRRIYQEQCERCHGVEGRDGPFDRLAGREPDDAFPFALDPRVPRTIGSYWPHATTIFDYTRRAMPLDRPGSLDDDAVYALTAYLLHLNDLWDLDTPLDETNLPRVVMPARDRFVPDDRRGGPELR